MLQRLTALSFVTFFAIAAGCTATSSGTGGDDTDAGGTSSKDAGKKDGSSSSTSSSDDAGDTKDSGSTKKDSGTVDTDADVGDADLGDADPGDGSTVIDAAADVVTDSAVADTGTDAALVCAPGSVAGFSPTWKLPNALHANKCTAQQVDDIMAACAGPSSTVSACDSAMAAAPTCSGCLVTAESATTYGAIITTMNGDVWNLNVAGCIARTANDVTSTGCGAKVQASDQCQGKACDANCASAPINDYFTCESDAIGTGGGCASYETAAGCRTTAFAAASATCDPSSGIDFYDNAIRYGKLFCVP